MAQGLCKQYGRTTAVDSVELRVAPGQICALIGENGAGKTTLLRLLCGLSLPDAGSARVLGQAAFPGARVGCLIGEPLLYRELTMAQNMEIYRQLHRCSPDEMRESMAKLGVDAFADKRGGALSAGMAMRAGLAMAMMGRPELLVLDEPLNGLDPAGVRDVRRLILEMNTRHGTTVLVSSHALGEVEKWMTACAVMHRGRLAMLEPLPDGSPGQPTLEELYFAATAAL